MALRRRWSAGCVLLALAALPGCSSAELNSEDFPSDSDYMFGGQTGSLVPGCGVAPLSESGQALPAGDVIAVVYTSGCPTQAPDDLVSVAAQDASSVSVELEPLGESGAYLVRSDSMLAPGRYRVELGGNSGSTLLLAPEVSPLPAQLGSIEAMDPAQACADMIELQLSLDAAALAYAPLLRLYARVDGGSEQLLVDYGALEVQAGSNVGVLRLPRCGTACLGRGSHLLEVRGVIAGEELALPVAVSSFDIDCGEPVSDASSSCAVSRTRSGEEGRLLVLIAASLPALRRAARRCSVKFPRST